MRRASGGFEVPIVAPTLGLITRVSSEEPDVRSAAVASNVRFEKGVAKNAQGMKTMTLTPGLDSAANMIFQTQFYQPSLNVGIVGTARKIYSITTPGDASKASLFQLYDYGSNVAGIRNRIVGCSFYDKCVFAQPNSEMVFWNGLNSLMLPVIGLDPNQRFQGVNVFRNYVVAWSGNIFQWCATDDMTCWIPVGSTATSALLHTTQPFTMPPLDGITTSGWIYVDSATAALLAVGQFMSMIYGGTTTYFSVTATIPATGESGQVSGFSQMVPIAATQDIFVNTFIPYTVGGQLYFENNSAILTVTTDAIAPDATICQLAAQFTAPSVGQQVTVSTTTAPQFTSGNYVSVGPYPNAGIDIYQVVGVNLSANTITLMKTSTQFTQATIHFAGEFIVGQPHVTVANNSAVVASGNFSTSLLECYGFQATTEVLTGALAAGTVIATDTEILSVDANGAGQVENAGVQVNGPLLWFDTLGDYGYIFKNRSVQSVQYVGIDQGTFFIRPEITNEGLLGNYSFCKVAANAGVPGAPAVDTMYFFGNREIYKYTGGNQLAAVARQHSVEVYAELDRTRANEIVGYHNEASFEVWFAYPVIGGSSSDASYRVLIYNYIEDSCTIDDYDPSVHPALILHGITAVARLNLAQNIPWNQAQGSWVAPLSWPASQSWQGLNSDAPLDYSVAGFQLNEAKGAPTLALLNQGYDRDGNAMLCQYETADFDARDSQVWKYHDTLHINFQVIPGLVIGTNPLVVTVQIGSRKNLDSSLVWSNPVEVNCQGDGNYVTKADIRRMGRYLRVRINSNQINCGWRISKMVPEGRLGGPY